MNKSRNLIPSHSSARATPKFHTPERRSLDACKVVTFDFHDFQEEKVPGTIHNIQPLPKWPPACWHAVLISYGVVVRVNVYLRNHQYNIKMRKIILTYM